LQRDGKLKPRGGTVPDSSRRGNASKRKSTGESRTASEKNQQALSDIRAKRQARDKPKLPSTSASSSRSDIPDVDVDRSRRSKQTKTSSDTASIARNWVSTPLTQLQRVVIRRSNLEAWFREAYFEKVVTGCFVRVLVGSDQGRKVYRLAQVKGKDLKYSY
jgi:RNA polymerase-associated protein RTF1